MTDINRVLYMYYVAIFNKCVYVLTYVRVLPYSAKFSRGKILANLVGQNKAAKS